MEQVKLLEDSKAAHAATQGELNTLTGRFQKVSVRVLLDLVRYKIRKEGAGTLTAEALHLCSGSATRDKGDMVAHTSTIGDIATAIMAVTGDDRGVLFSLFAFYFGVTVLEAADDQDTFNATVSTFKEQKKNS